MCDAPVAAGPVVIAVAAGQDSCTAGFGAGTAQFGKTAQMTLVRLVLWKWGRGTRNPHRSHADPLRPDGDPDRDLTRSHREVGVGQQRQVGIRSNGDA